MFHSENKREKNIGAIQKLIHEEYDTYAYKRISPNW